ncbi:glycoside hydrolase family 25 protein [Lactarius akahatsu]|uniref:Lysozyme n=1 Tax=Lactarius akahatsu TaxID=416441 RepID=A0AAD4QFR1_9AGAM|nr:glycoside hydrolase family 25 protein [Lactarius akahatsu]
MGAPGGQTRILHKLRCGCRVNFPSASFLNMRSLLQLIALATLSRSLGVAGAPAPEPAAEGESGPALGCDVSNWQGNLNWATIKSQGVQFAYIKATEGTTFIDSYFSQNYVGATNNGIIRGAYHFAHPDTSSGAAQANFFLAHGGGWSADGITLPGAIDLEGSCAGLTAAQMVSWIHDFANTYHAATSSWWTSCTGNNAGFGSTSPLWIAHWAASIGTLPAGWSYTTFWQYADSGTYPGDQDLFNGDAAGLKRMALGS